MLQRRGKFFSDLNFAIVETFRDNNIVVPSSDVGLVLNGDSDVKNRKAFANINGEFAEPRDASS